MQTIRTPKLTDIMPESLLNDPKFRASAEVLDLELERLSTAAREVLHIPRLDELSGKILDFIGEQVHCDFWEPLYLTDAEKKNLIRTSIAWHRIKGTPAAVEQIANAAFREAEVIEWFDYGGRPYHFWIKTRGFKKTPEGFKTFLRMLYMAKNVRSWCDKIIIDYPAAEMNLYYGVVPIETGRKVTGIAHPEDKRIDLYAGIVTVKGGRTGTFIGKPQDTTVTAHIGMVNITAGRKFILPDPDDFIPRRHFVENAIADIAIADVAIARPSDVPEAPEPVDPEVFVIPDGDWLRVYMDFPTGRDHPILLKNPRDDLTVSDIKAVGDDAVTNKIFLNSRAEGTLGISRVDLIRGFAISGQSSAALVPESGQLRLFFNFPQGNMRKILVTNPRHNITVGDIQKLGREAAAQKLLLNARMQATSGITHAAIIKHFKINDKTVADAVTFNTGGNNHGKT